MVNSPSLKRINLNTVLEIYEKKNKQFDNEALKIAAKRPAQDDCPTISAMVLVVHLPELIFKRGLDRVPPSVPPGGPLGRAHLRILFVSMIK